jgi:hypothetical protein
MKLFIASLLVFTGTAFAGDMAPVSYHDGTLVGLPCSGNPDQTCSADYQGEYMVKSEGILYALTPVSTAERATLGWGKGFSKYSSLDHQAPGTAIRVRDDGKHFYVKVGNRESMYSAIEAR